MHNSVNLDDAWGHVHCHNTETRKVNEEQIVKSNQQQTNSEEIIKLLNQILTVEQKTLETNNSILFAIFVSTILVLIAISNNSKTYEKHARNFM